MCNAIASRNKDNGGNMMNELLHEVFSFGIGEVSCHKSHIEGQFDDIVTLQVIRKRLRRDVTWNEGKGFLTFHIYQSENIHAFL